MLAITIVALYHDGHSTPVM